MTPYELGQDPFRATADSRFNSFTDPWNGVNANPGSWGVDSRYMTPAYLSPYRPRYSGPQSSSGQYGDPGFLESANLLFNPLRSGGSNYGGDVFQQNSAYVSSLVNRPIDTVVSIAQNYLAPAAVGYAAFHSKGAVFRGSATVGRKFFGGMARGVGMSGASSVLAGKAGAFTTSMIGGGLALQAGVTAANSMFDIYTSSRQASDYAYRNFSGISFADPNMAGVPSGRGLSHQASARIGRDITMAGSLDPTFSKKEFTALTDLVSRSGMLDNVPASQLSRAMTTAAKQVKMVLTAANTSDVREAVEIMAKLAQSGVNIKDIGATAQILGGYASSAGISTLKFLNTTGMQGQMMAQAAGLTPIAGMMVAGQTHASLAAAARTGLVSRQVLAQMGGVEGATQSAVSGMMSAYSTPYMAMAGYNQMKGRGGARSIVDTINSFGASMAENPLSTMGEFNLKKPSLISNMMAKGPADFLVYMKHLADVTPNMKTPDGRVDSYSMFQMMLNSGIKDSDARAIMATLAGYQGKDSTKHMTAGIASNAQSQRYGAAVQGKNDLGFFSPVYNAIAGNLNFVGSRLADNSILEKFGGFADSTNQLVYKVGFGNFGQEINSEAFLKRSSTDKIRQLTLPSIYDEYMNYKDGKYARLAAKVNQASRIQGNPTAKALMAAKGVDRENLAYQLVKQGVLPHSLLHDRDALKDFLDGMDKFGSADLKAPAVNVNYNFSTAEDRLNNFSKTDGGGKLGKLAEMTSLALDMVNQRGSDTDYLTSDSYKNNAARLGKLLGTQYSEFDMENVLKNVLASGDSAQIGGIAKVFKDYNDRGINLNEEISEYGLAATSAKYINDKSIAGRISSSEQFYQHLAAQQGMAVKVKKGYADQGLFGMDFGLDSQYWNKSSSDIAAAMGINITEQVEKSKVGNNHEVLSQGFTKFNLSVDEFSKAVDTFVGKDTFKYQVSETSGKLVKGFRDWFSGSKD